MFLSFYLPVTLASIPFFGTGFILASSGQGAILDYGALGICLVAVVGLFAHLNKISDSHRVERQELVDTLKAQEEGNREVTENTIRVLGNLAKCLEDRPCVANDSRTQVDKQ